MKWGATMKECNTCHYWREETVDRAHICCNIDSGMVTCPTEENYGCYKWREKAHVEVEGVKI